MKIILAYNVESRIIQTERKYQQKKDSSKNDDTVKQAREQVENYGDDDAKAAWSELEESYELAETAEEKGFIANKMSNLGFEAMTTNYSSLMHGNRAYGLPCGLPFP